jgi:hypothetical protein
MFSSKEICAFVCTFPFANRLFRKKERLVLDSRFYFSKYFSSASDSFRISGSIRGFFLCHFVLLAYEFRFIRAPHTYLKEDQEYCWHVLVVYARMTNR